jgi:hypothetical protein
MTSQVMYLKTIINVGFEAFAVVVINVAILLDIAPCALYVNRNFTNGLHGVISQKMATFIII